MEQTSAAQSSPFTQLQAINLAKIITILLLGSCAIALYWQRIQAREQAMLAKYENYPDYQQASKQLIPFIW